MVVCSKCGEVNSDNFRFCGMCGTVLEAKPDSRGESRRQAGVASAGLSSPAPSPVPAQSSFGQPPLGHFKTVNLTEPVAPAVRESVVRENAPRPANQPVQPVQLIGGPSVLGLNQPSMDSLREKAFSGLDSFLEPEQPRTGGRRIFLMFVLLAALGAAGWWTYTNYAGVAEPRKAASAAKQEQPAEESSAAIAPRNGAPASPAGQLPPAEAAHGSDSATSDSDEGAAVPAATAVKAGDAESKPRAETKAPALAFNAAASTAPVEKRPAKRVPVATSAIAPRTPAAVAPDTGDAAFRKGEAYLYGRGTAENCDEAVKNLKAASAKSNAKARGAFGTMYATGHCVQRDLPTSYLWFALALRADPNNQILEKDLNAIWNQMTPPERQAATRMKE